MTMECINCYGAGEYWTEGDPESCRKAGCIVVDTPDVDFDGTTLIKCPECYIYLLSC